MSGAQSHADDELPAEPETDPKPAPPAITLRDGLRWALDVLERLAVTDEDYEYGDGEPVNAGPVVAKLRALLGASVEPLAAVDLDALEAAASSGDLGLVDDTVLSLIARLRAAEALLGEVLPTCTAELDGEPCAAPSTSGCHDYDSPDDGCERRCDRHRNIHCDYAPLEGRRESHPFAPALRAWLDLRGAS